MDGEVAEEANIVYDIAGLKAHIEQQEVPEKEFAGKREQPVIVVGDGISAADAVLHCFAHDIPVVHVFRRSERELRST